MERNFNQRVGLIIFKARKKKKLSRAALGEIVNLHESTIKRYEDGQIKTLDIEKMKEFAKALDIPPEELMGWNDPNLTNNINKFVQNLTNITDIASDIGLEEEDLITLFNSLIPPITVYGKVCAGDGIEALEDPIDEIGDPYYRIVAKKFALLVDGDSMNNIVDDGMYAIIQKTPVVKNGEIAVVLIDNEVGMLKRFYRIDESTVILKPDSTNNEHKLMVFEGKEINRLHILGRYLGCVSPMEKLL